MYKVIVTGATGFIGKALTLRLLEEGKTVYAIVRDKRKIEELQGYSNLIPIVVNLKDYSQLPQLIKDDDEIDIFYHFAWQGVAGESFKDYELQLSNAKFACDALMAAIKIKCKKFVFAGTINEYEIRKYLNMDYNIKPRYTCIYATSKLASEMICKTLSYNYGIEYNAGLIAMGYGEGKKQNVLPNVIIKNFINGEIPKLIEGNNLYDLIYIDDIVNAFILIGEKGVNQKSYYIGHRNLKTFKEIVTDVKNVVNPNLELVFGEYKDTLDMDYSLVDLDALYNDTGFECKSDFNESVLLTADWVKANL
jgi:nucleoside-diphosphate-sugar epimerase